MGKYLNKAIDFAVSILEATRDELIARNEKSLSPADLLNLLIKNLIAKKK